MPDYRSPGVYVEEVPSAIRLIAGVRTSTAAFIGAFADADIANVIIAGDRIAAEEVGIGDDMKTEFDLENYPVVTDPAAMRTWSMARRRRAA